MLEEFFKNASLLHYQHFLDGLHTFKTDPFDDSLESRGNE